MNYKPNDHQNFLIVQVMVLLEKDSFNLNMSIGTIDSPIVLSCISEYGNFSIINALLTTCLKSELFAKNLSIVELFLDTCNFSYNFLKFLLIIFCLM